MLNKKVVALLMVLMLMAGVLAGCGGDTKKEADSKTDDKTATDSKDKDSGEKTDKDGGETKAEAPMLKWVTVGGGKPSNYDAWQKKVNEYIEPLIGAKIDVEVISWGDWDNRRNVILNSGEPFDLLFSNSGSYNKDVTLGAFADITDLVNGSDKLQGLIPKDYWKAAEIGGKIYGVPTYKDSSITQYFVWDKAMLDKYEITDYEKINSLQAAEPALKKITDGEGKPAFPMHKAGAYQVFDTYDTFNLGMSFIGVKYDDKEGKVVNALEQEDVKAELRAVRKMYQEGVINADAFTATETPAPGTIFGIAQGWPMAAETAWGPQRGAEAVVSQYTPTILTNASVLGSINCVSSGSKYPDKAIAVLELANTDTKFRDMLFFGEEGVNFEYQDGKVNKLNEEWTMAGYTQATFFNVSMLVGVEKNQWDEVKELNANATPSVLLGFQIDTTNIQNEIANVGQIWETDRAEILTGAKEPDEAIAATVERMKAAGLDNIIAECQKQIDAFLGK